MSLLSDDDCTRIYNEANEIAVKNPPITTERIFKAMRLAHAQGFAAGAAAQLAEKPSGYLSQYNLEMLQQGYPQTIVMIEGAKRDVPLYTRREA